MKMNLHMKLRRAQEAARKAAITIFAGMAILLASQVYAIPTADADETAAEPPALRQSTETPAFQQSPETPVAPAPLETPDLQQPPVLQQPLETPAAPEPARIDESLARILLFEKKIAGKRISEAERREIAEQIVRYSRILGIQPELGAALIAKESRFNPRASSRGYKGLGQLCATAARNNGVKNPYDIEQNVRATLSYLKQMMNIWEGRPDRIERALASYNSGAGAVRRRGPGISRKFINGVLKYKAEIFAMDIKPLITKASNALPGAPAGE